MTSALKFGKFGVTRTGKIHHALGPNASVCSASMRGQRMSIVSETYVQGHSETAFCKKCFPQGNPLKKGE